MAGKASNRIAGEEDVFVIRRPGYGWFAGEDTHSILYADRPYGASRLSKADAKRIANTKRGDKILSLSKAIDLCEAEKEEAHKIGIIEANTLAEQGQGFTDKEWDKMPYRYTGICTKGCDGPRLMTQGPIWEFGVRGVYVCSRCGYAYPPSFPPEKKGGFSKQSQQALQDLQNRSAASISEREELVSCKNTPDTCGSYGR